MDYEVYRVLDYFDSDSQEHWLAQIGTSDWGAGKFLHELLRDGRFRELTGESSTVLLLTEGEKLVSFCTLAEKDDIQPTDLTPWIGFVYTFPSYRGRRLAGKMLRRAEELAALAGHDCVYISTNHTGLYEKYGYTFQQLLPDMEGEESRVYRKELRTKT